MSPPDEDIWEVVYDAGLVPACAMHLAVARQAGRERLDLACAAGARTAARAADRVVSAAAGMAVAEAVAWAADMGAIEAAAWAVHMASSCGGEPSGRVRMDDAWTAYAAVSREADRMRVAMDEAVGRLLVRPCEPEVRPPVCCSTGADERTQDREDPMGTKTGWRSRPASITRTTDPVGLRIEGDVDAGQHDLLAGELSEVLAAARAGEGVVHLDLSGLSFIDLRALNLLAGQVRDEGNGVRVVLDNLSPDVGNLIDTLGWERLPGLERGTVENP
ncbi:STAS domain-containing protein [Thermomonospora amylolytica]|uniref:STAS domain-containing protein n=1 Tax=Thermomonospora amylolytica TaxID=1411117 RepID=UPI0013002CD7|nr:STAS domain-containing protein [Thermomonospora amylolytica]